MLTYAESERGEMPSLYEELQAVPDSRDDQGKRHTLAATLALACVALLCGYQNPNAISEWAENYGKRDLKHFGFTVTGLRGKQLDIACWVASTDQLSKPVSLVGLDGCWRRWRRTASCRG
jgi:hypothetical protein